MDKIKPAVQHVIEALQAAADVDGNEEKAKRIMAETRLRLLSLLGDKPGREKFTSQRSNPRLAGIITCVCL